MDHVGRAGARRPTTSPTSLVLACNECNRRRRTCRSWRGCSRGALRGVYLLLRRSSFRPIKDMARQATEREIQPSATDLASGDLAIWRSAIETADDSSHAIARSLDHRIANRPEGRCRINPGCAEGRHELAPPPSRASQSQHRQLPMGHAVRYRRASAPPIARAPMPQPRRRRGRSR